MKRTLLLNQLLKYEPKAPEEIVYKKSIVQFVQEHENCFERSLQAGHITASCWLLNNDESHALLMHHAKLNIWVQLGGHADGDHDLLRVAIKEAQEESGIDTIIPAHEDIFDIDIHLVPPHKNIPAHYHYDIRFLLKVVGDANFVQNSESKALQWFDKNKTNLPTQEFSITRMFDKWILGSLHAQEHHQCHSHHKQILK